MFFITKTLIIDGNYLLKRSYHGAKHTFNSKGQNIGGLYQFMTMMRKLIKEHGINKCIVFFDGENGGKLRYDIYRGYKGNRDNKSWYDKIELNDKQIQKEEERKTLLWQKIRIQNYLENLFIRQLEVEYMESDDLIAYYCKTMCEKERIMIYTNDRDMCQLLGYKNVSIYMANLNMFINKDNYFLNFKHDVQNAKLIKVICGDTSDNIKGIDGCGEDTLLKYFPELKKEKIELQHIIDKSKELNEERVKNKQKPLKVLENIVQGKFNTITDGGMDQYELNEKIINLLEPFLTKSAISQCDAIANQPLDITGRTSKNLLAMMIEDDFLMNYPNADFNAYVNPFIELIVKEKKFSE
jgi:DNA polymerase-1